MVYNSVNNVIKYPLDFFFSKMHNGYPPFDGTLEKQIYWKCCMPTTFQKEVLPCRHFGYKQVSDPVLQLNFGSENTPEECK